MCYGCVTKILLMASVRIILNSFRGATKERKDGTFPISLVLYHNRKRKYFPLGRSCKPNQWNKEASRFKKNYPNFKKENDILISYEKRALDIIYDFERNQVPFEFDQFTQRFSIVENSSLVIPFFESKIRERIEGGKFKSAELFKTALNHMIRYCKEHRRDPQKLTFNGLTHPFLKGLTTYLETKRGCANGSISAYMRSIRILVNEAIQDKITDRYEFSKSEKDKKYKIPHSDPNKRALNREEWNAIENLIPNGGPNYELALDLFKFSYYAFGINFTDIARLKSKNVAGDVLRYWRRKTMHKRNRVKEFEWPMGNDAIRIINKYKERMICEDGYIFPILDVSFHIEDRQIHDRIKKVQKQVNRILKSKIAVDAGIDRVGNLTFYYARHTFATLKRDEGLSINEIAALLHHKDIKATQIYIDDLTLSQKQELTRKAFAA